MPAGSRRRAVLSVLLAVVAATVVVGVGGGPAAAAPATSLPADPNAQGYVGLCDQNGHNVTGGSVDTTPFVWKAVASQPPPAAYQGTGENAVLNAYQPRPQVLPAEWSGTALTGASFYSTKARPAVQATYADLSLAQFIQEYPPQVDGLYVLRIYYGKANYGLYNAKYPTTTIQVTGKTWKVVDGGTVDCAAAKAISNEQLTGVVSKRDTIARAPSAAEQTVPGATNHPITTAPSRSSTATAARSGASSAAPGSVAATPAAATTHSGGSGPSWLLWALLVLVVVLAGALVLVARARRAPPPTES